MLAIHAIAKRPSLLYPLNCRLTDPGDRLQGDCLSSKVVPKVSGLPVIVDPIDDFVVLEIEQTHDSALSRSRSASRAIRRTQAVGPV
jgi:hypothetical protein